MKHYINITDVSRIKESGFTIIELMVSMTVGLLLMSIIGGIYFSAVQSASQISSRISLNRSAREMFDIVAYGGYNGNANTTTATLTTATVDEHNYIFGINGRDNGATTRSGWTVPSSLMTLNSTGTATPETYFLGLSPSDEGPEIGSSGTVAANSPIVSSETAASVGSSAGVSVTCSDSVPGDPIEGCSSGETRYVRGNLRGDVHLGVPAVTDTDAGTKHITLLVMNPQSFNLKENLHRADITEDGVFDTYWTAFAPLVEAHR